MNKNTLIETREKKLHEIIEKLESKQTVYLIDCKIWCIFDNTAGVYKTITEQYITANINKLLIKTLGNRRDITKHTKWIIKQCKIRFAEQLF